jgi:hypothetical protein
VISVVKNKNFLPQKSQRVVGPKGGIMKKQGIYLAIFCSIFLGSVEAEQAAVPIPPLGIADVSLIAAVNRDSRDRRANQRDTRLQRQYFYNRDPYYYGSPYNKSPSYYYYYSRPRDFYNDQSNNGAVYYYPNE